MKDLSRLSLNQISIKRWSLAQAIEGCARHGVGHIGVWRDKLGEQSFADTQRQLRHSGVAVSSLCRGGFFSAPTAEARAASLDDNRRAIDDCAAIGSPLLVLVCGPANGQTLLDARSTVSDAVHTLEPYARACGVRLGIEPLHPMYAAERSVMVTLQQANELAEAVNSPFVGVVVDVFHVWWDPRVEAEIARSGARLLGFHVSDWLVPLPDLLLGRGLMGEGVIAVRHVRQCADAAGFSGPIEVEIFNQTLWDRDPDEALRAIRNAYLEVV